MEFVKFPSIPQVAGPGVMPIQQIRTCSGFMPGSWFTDDQTSWEDIDETHPLVDQEGGVTTIFCTVLSVIQLREKPEEV
jgi:hypothetical protein